MMGQIRQRRMRGMDAVMSLVRQELAPLRQAIILILKTLHIEHQLPPISIKPTRRKTPKRHIKNQKNIHIQDPTNLDDMEDITGIDDIDEIDIGEQLQHWKPSEPVLARKEEVVVPRGNNTRFKAQQLPEQAPKVTEGRDEWERLWKQTRRLVDGKRTKGERGWFDFEKKMLVELVSRGRALGADVGQLTLLLGLSPTTLKRWRINLPFCHN